MTSQRKLAKKRDPDQITAPGKPDEDEGVVIARTVLSPVTQAAVTLKEYGKVYGELDLPGLVKSLTAQTRASSNGDLERGEAMLTAQAHTLDAIFNNLARRAALNMGEYMQACETYLKLALRSQSQCRATWETLAAVKNPPMVGYVRQANIAHGPQQVNNAPSSPNEASRTRENQNLQDKLLEAKDGERLDTGKTSTPGRTDPAMATVGEVDGTQDSKR
jgi:hypothetical protein